MVVLLKIPLGIELYMDRVTASTSNLVAYVTMRTIRLEVV